MIAAHADTNSLVLTAPQDIMNAMLEVIGQLDIRRAQVLIEALIVEMAEGDGINLGVQWGSLESGSVIQYGNTGASIGNVMIGLEEAKDTTEKNRSVIVKRVRSNTTKRPQPKVITRSWHQPVWFARCCGQHRTGRLDGLNQRGL